MKKKYKRRKRFVHASSQLKYIAFSILPALIMSLFCISFLIGSGELVLRAAKEKPMVPFYSIRQTIINLEKEGYTKDTMEKTRRLKNELNSLKNILETTYFDTLQQWNKTRWIILAVLFWALLLTALLALVYSHRIAGPLFRIRRCIDMLCAGEDIPPVRLRKHDEFKELADSLDKLRMNLKDKGLLESKDEEHAQQSHKS